MPLSCGSPGEAASRQVIMGSGLCQLPLAGLPIPHHSHKSSRHNHLQQTPTPVGVAVHKRPQQMLLKLGVKLRLGEGRWLFVSAAQLSQVGCICTTCQCSLLWLNQVLSCELQVSEYQGNRQVTLSRTGYADLRAAAVCLKNVLTATIKQQSSTCIYMHGQ